MDFLVLHLLTKSELGWFAAFRRTGRETSRQRAINFDGDVVDRVFPAAHEEDQIPIHLRYLASSDEVLEREQTLRRQEKNWRLTGPKVEESFYDFVEEGCLLALQIQSGQTPAVGSLGVFPKDSPLTRAILHCPESKDLIKASMIALYGAEGAKARSILASHCPLLFEDLEFLPVEPLTEVPQLMAHSDLPEGPVVLPPDPGGTIALLASVGYSLPSALADLVDNSIVAGATKIDILMGNPNEGHGRWLALVDDGRGMDALTLMEAMRVGSRREYGPRDLGKYGYGLKGASWSQADRVTVVTRKSGDRTHHLIWDRRHLETTNTWEALRDHLEEWENDVSANRIDGHGTAILWTNMRPPAAVKSKKSDKSPFAAELGAIASHLALVFHRYLEGKAQGNPKLTITLNGDPIQPNDPMQSTHPLTRHCDHRSIPIPTEGGESRVLVKPHILPSESEITEHFKDNPSGALEFLRKSRLQGRSNEGQGLYIYRNDRLICMGGWRDLFAPDEHMKLARVAVDFESDLDDALQVNISKMTVSFPYALSEGLKAALAEPRKQARQRYDKRSVTPPPPRPANPLSGGTTPAPAPTGEGPQGSVDGPIPIEVEGTVSVPIAGSTPASVDPGVSPGSMGTDEVDGGTGIKSTIIKKVALDGKLWRIRESFSSRVLEISMHNPRLLAIHAALLGKAEAVSALADILSAAEEASEGLQSTIQLKLGD